jgi:hypothetical protein
MDEIAQNLKNPAWWFSTVFIGLLVGLVAPHIQKTFERYSPAGTETALEITSYVYVSAIFIAVTAVPFLRDTVHVGIFGFWLDVLVFAALGIAALIFYLRVFSSQQLVFLLGLNVAVLLFFLTGKPRTDAGLVYRLTIASAGYSLLVALIAPLIIRVLRWVKGASHASGS